ncbi:MAG: autotransporter outer membrane beta-barrel domain-containing protein [Elusimicrobiota bacterium]|jgi:hypothetical protein|nr:autotransporter outer membrane beta-barrel domain-containing protein [Elusimicrobiota bacterium]
MKKVLAVLNGIIISVIFVSVVFAQSPSSPPFLNVSPISHNQSQVQDFFNNYNGNDSGLLDYKQSLKNLSDAGERDKAKEILEDLSGGFLINVLTAQSNLKTHLKLFDRIKKNKSDLYIIDQVVWFQFDYDSFENKDDESGNFKSGKSEWQAGVDLLKGDGFTAGLYIGNGSNNIEQGLNKADISFFEFGLYGASLNRYINILGNLGLEIQKFHTTRQIRFANLSPESDFNANAFKWGLEFEANMLNEGYTRLSPFISLDGIHQSYDAIKEKNGESANLIFDRGVYSKSIMTYGLRGQTRGYEFNFSASLYGGYIMSGSDFSNGVSFEQGGQYSKMNIIKGPADDIFMGLSVGAGRIISDIAEIYVNVDFSQADSFSGFLIQGGIKLGFGSERPKRTAQKARKSVQPTRANRDVETFRQVRETEERERVIVYDDNTEIELKREIRTETPSKSKARSGIYTTDMDDVQNNEWMSERMLETLTESSSKRGSAQTLTPKKTKSTPSTKSKSSAVKSKKSSKTKSSTASAVKQGAQDDNKLVAEITIKKKAAKTSSSKKSKK